MKEILADLQIQPPKLSESKTPLRVALVSDWFAPRLGGIESHLLSLAKSLKLRGIEPTIITSYPGEAEIDTIRVLRLPVRIMPFAKIAYSPFLRSILHNCLKDGNFDIVHIHPSIVAPVCLAAVPAARDLKLPMILTFHSIMTTLPFGLHLADRMTNWSGWDLSLTAVSRTVAEQVRRIGSHRPIEILPNGFDHEFWSLPRHQSIPNEDRPFRIVTSMRLKSRKRPFALLDIFRHAEKLLAPNNRKLELIIAGDGPAKPGLERAIQRHRLADRCRIEGWISREQLRDIYHDCHAFIMPSVKESFCIAALEARASGLPVIARSKTGIEDYIQHGTNGLLTDSDIAMAQAIADLVNNAAKWRMIAGAQSDHGAYSWPKLAEEHEVLYRSALSASAAG